MPTVLRETYYKANKNHKCDFCDRTITPAMCYKATVIKDGMHVYTVKTCSRCESYVSEFFRSLLASGTTEYDFDEFKDYMINSYPSVAHTWWPKGVLND